MKKHLVQFRNGYVIFTAEEVHATFEAGLVTVVGCTVLEDTIYDRFKESKDVKNNTIFRDEKIKGEITFYNVSHYKFNIKE